MLFCDLNPLIWFITQEMFKSIRLSVLLAVQLGSWVVANQDSTSLERRDTASFFAAEATLINAANTFAADRYSGAFPANIPELEGIAAHIKACSDAYDASLIQLASITSPTFSTPLLSPADAATFNATFVPAHNAILANLNSMQAGKAFFESVNNNALLLTMFCHWISGLSREVDVFLGRLTVAAPSTAYSIYWAQLKSTAAFQYQIWLDEDGFNCAGL